VIRTGLGCMSWLGAINLTNMKTEKLKPNGKPMGVFVVTIDDGFCAYRYEYKPRRSCSIHDLNKRFSRALKAPVRDGVYVPNVAVSEPEDSAKK